MRAHRTGRRRLGLWIAAALAALWCAPAGHARAQGSARMGALSLVEAGFAADGKTLRYSLEANGADLQDVLAALLRKTGREYVINQDITGPISLTLRDKTLDDILQAICGLARPPITLQMGDRITVALAPAANDPAAQPGHEARPSAAAGVTALRTQYAPVLPGQSLTLGRPVSLSIPDDRPAPLRTVLQQIEGQTRVPIRLDPRIPGDIGVAARFTDTPLSLVLESVGRTGALKWQLRPDGSVWIAPSDWLLVSVRGLPAWGHPTQTCPTCKKPVLPSWRYCPSDGTALRRQDAPSAPPSRSR